MIAIVIAVTVVGLAATGGVLLFLLVAKKSREQLIAAGKAEG